MLRHFALQLCSAVRERDLAARVGGEEFALHVVNMEEKRAVELMDQLLDGIRDGCVAYDDVEIRYTISIGAALAELDVSIEELLRDADRQLYNAKATGRDRWVLMDRATAGRWPAAARAPYRCHRAACHAPDALTGKLEIQFRRGATSAQRKRPAKRRA